MNAVVEASVSVVMKEDRGTWRVVIADGAGGTLLERTCRDAAEARTFASTVRQHLYWLSPERFRIYYGLDGEPAPPTDAEDGDG